MIFSSWRCRPLGLRGPVGRAVGAGGSVGAAPAAAPARVVAARSSVGLRAHAVTAAGRAEQLVGARQDHSARHRATTSRARSRYAAAPAEDEREAGDRLAGDRGLREPHGAVDHGVEDLVAERLHHPAQHLAAVQRPAVVHRRKNPLKFKLRVKPLAHFLYSLDQQCDASEREVLTLERDDDAVGGGQRVDGQQAERRLAVDQDEVVVVEHRLRGPA